jgi:hypothetical protein
MSRFQVYIKPFDDDGNYQSDFIEVTKDVAALANLKETIDADDYNTGIFRYGAFSMGLNDITGRYSDVGGATTIFKFKRSGSQVKITWSIGNDITEVGDATVGDALTNFEYTVFEGLLSDLTMVTAIKQQKANFKVLTLDSILDEVETNYSSISNGESVDTILFTILNQSSITTLLTVSAGNINSALNSNVDDVSGFENQTVRETVQELLGLSNSVLYIKDRTIYVSDRTPTAAVQKTFYGQASITGIEDIININNIRSGLNKVFNLISWEDTALVSRDTSSITSHGVRKKEVGFASITNGTTRQNILDNIKTEFGTIKQELILSTPIDYTTISLAILDRVAIDYPTVFKAVDGEELPILGQVVLGSFSLPYGEWSFYITTSTNYKILDRTVGIKRQEMIFKLKEI